MFWIQRLRHTRKFYCLGAKKYIYDIKMTINCLFFRWFIPIIQRKLVKAYFDHTAFYGMATFHVLIRITSLDIRSRQSNSTREITVSILSIDNKIYRQINERERIDISSHLESNGMWDNAFAPATVLASPTFASLFLSLSFSFSSHRTHGSETKSYQHRCCIMITRLH